MSLQTLTIAKALKRKNKLSGEIKQLQLLIHQENRINDSKIRNINILEEEIELNKKITELISIKSAITRANKDIVSKIYSLSEFKSLIKFYQQLPVEKGFESETVGYNNIEKVKYTVIIDKREVLLKTKELQNKIDMLQEELDRFNFTTNISYDPEIISDSEEDLPF